MDHRSFKYMFEIAIISNETVVNEQLNQHIQQTLSLSEPFEEKGIAVNTTF